MKSKLDTFVLFRLHKCNCKHHYAAFSAQCHCHNIQQATQSPVRATRASLYRDCACVMLSMYMCSSLTTTEIGHRSSCKCCERHYRCDVLVDVQPVSAKQTSESNNDYSDAAANRSSSSACSHSCTNCTGDVCYATRTQYCCRALRFSTAIYTTAV
eukprot:20610-Heterococcus_DN1.PRE.3